MPQKSNTMIDLKELVAAWKKISADPEVRANVIRWLSIGYEEQQFLDFVRDRESIVYEINHEGDPANEDTQTLLGDFRQADVTKGFTGAMGHYAFATPVRVTSEQLEMCLR